MQRNLPDADKNILIHFVFVARGNIADLICKKTFTVTTTNI